MLSNEARCLRRLATCHAAIAVNEICSTAPSPRMANCISEGLVWHTFVELDSLSQRQIVLKEYSYHEEQSVHIRQQGSSRASLEDSVADSV